MRHAGIAACLVWLLGCGPGDTPAAPAPASPAESSASDPYPILIPAGDEVSAGNMRFRVVSARIDRHESHPDGAPKTLALRVGLRVTELDSRDTRLTGDEIRVLAGGRAYAAQSPPSVTLWASQSVDLDDLVFVVPAPLDTASLQVGTPEGASALLALRIPH